MPLQRSLRTALAVGLVALAASASDARAQEVFPRGIDANVNDPGIDPARGQNLIWMPAAARRVDKLLLFLPLGGMNNRPTEFDEIGSEGARLGYHTIVLAYKNEVPIANATACGNEEAPLPAPAPENCAINARMEILNGGGQSPVIAVTPANGIDNRLNKVLQYLATTFPAEGWSQFRDTGGAPMWSQIVMAGGSLGAGQAALIASLRSVHRVSMFSGWTDAKHGWVTLGATSPDRYFTLINAEDHFYGRTCFAYAVFGMTQTCPLTDPAHLVENRQPPFLTPQLVFNLQPDPTAPVINDPWHPSTVRDGYIPKQVAGGTAPSQKLVNGWRATFGDRDADSWLDQRDNCPVVPNPEQIDSDKNGIGDACGPTVIAGTVGGSVPATLSLTLGTPAAFGAFTPGVDRSYDANMTATVISTAGDTALSVHDAGTNAAGRLVNGAFSLSEPLQASATGTFAALSASPLTLLTYAAPVSNAPVTLAFRQHIGPTQALRTGAYSKTLTFTLSTTTP